MKRLELLWWGSVWFAPLLLPQALYARIRSIRLPEAQPPWHGDAGMHSSELRLAVVGDSTAAGVGTGDQRLAVTGQTANALASIAGYRVTWRAFGRNGATLADLKREFFLPVSEFDPDIVLLSVGVNDTTSFTSRGRWRADLLDSASAFRDAGASVVAVSKLPPMHLFSALPQPLRAFLGLRARLLDQDLQRLAAEHDAIDYLDVHFEPRPEYLAIDGYHPSAAGCAAWGQSLAAGLLELLPGLNPGRAAPGD